LRVAYGRMRPNVAMVVADVNLNMVAQARGAVTGASGVVALVYALPFPSGAFDVVVCLPIYGRRHWPTASVQAA
jgi:ubiquinone/menaquinone biosynthesis C-methylase UbiE